MKRRRLCGFTLIELLIALVILALLGIMSWRALSSMLDAREHLVTVESRWQRVARSLNLIEVNLMQVAERRSGGGAPRPDFELLTADSGTQRLSFLRSEITAGARLTGFALEEGRLMLLTWPGGDRREPPVAEALLDGVQSIRWQVLDKDLAWQPRWNTTGLPLGVKLELELTDVGPVERLFALH